MTQETPEQVINAIGDVFVAYQNDEELMRALKPRRYALKLFSLPLDKDSKVCIGGIWGDVRYFLNSKGWIYCYTSGSYGSWHCLINKVAQNYFELLSAQLGFAPSVTQARERLAEDLGKRVEKLKKDYARHFDRECDRQAESRYAQHPEV